MTTSHPHWRSWAALLRDSWITVRTGGARLIGILLATQILIALIALPVIRWLFREALRANGMTALDLGTMTISGGFTLTVTLIVVLCLLAFWVVSAQFTVLVIMLRAAQIGAPLTIGGVAKETWRVLRKLLRPSAFPLHVYLFIVLPLTGFGFTSSLVQGVAIPPFVSGELAKSPASSAALAIFLLVLTLLNLRLAMCVPVFILTDATGGYAIRLSWRLTRGVTVLPLLGAIIAVLLLAGLVAVGLVVASLVPTAITDFLAPDAAPVVAAYSLGAAQTLGMLLTGLVTAAITAVLLSYLDRHQDRLPVTRPLLSPQFGFQRTRPGPRAVVLACSLSAVVALSLGTVNIGVLQSLDSHPDTLVLGHRGFTEGGVENTIGGLEAAAAAGADLVEMDVMQTADGEFVVMHDTNLKRLTGEPLQVEDLSLAELTAMTVHDGEGREDRIPSLADYVTRAAEIGMPLLIEIKLSGAETDDHVDQLVVELEELDALDDNIYHSLDAPSVERLKLLRPDLTVGYTMAFAAVEAPDTPADFIVVEEWTATNGVQQSAAAAGLGFMVWTVNDEERQREFLRRGVDGLITDRPDTALASRESIRGESGLADTLLDSLVRFIVVF